MLRWGGQGPKRSTRDLLTGLPAGWKFLPMRANITLVKNFFVPRTPYTDEWRDFQEKYDSEWVDKEELEKVTKTLKEKFYRLDKNYDPII